MSGVTSLSRKSRKENTKNGFGKKLLETALEIYEIPDISMPVIQARGNREICIEGCKGILEYEEGRIMLNCGKLVICFTGDGIEITAYSELQTVITGNVLSIDFQGASEV